MADFGFNRDDITNLAHKLGTIQSDLTHREWVLLLAIFAAAANRAEVTDAATGSSSLPNPEVVGLADGAVGYPDAADLQKQLLNAYIPGKYFDDLASGNKTVGLQNPRAKTGSSGAGEGGQPDK